LRAAAAAAWNELHGRETVLLVEDEPTVRNVIERLLIRHGYRVLAARHGAEALAMWGESADQIDVLITDLVMPEVGGRELVERLRRLRPDLRVLFVSGYDERAAVEEAPPNARFVMKPFDSRELLARLREVLER
jgi:CheY-like chemotaxis protein